MITGKRQANSESMAIRKAGLSHACTLFLTFRSCKGISTRYRKTGDRFLNFVLVADVFDWLNSF
jgi:hypothetical protein